MQIMRLGALWGAASVALMLVACSSSPKPKMVEMPANPGTVSLRSVWSTTLPAVRFAMQPRVAGTQLALASSDGSVVVLDAPTGKELWKAKLASGLSAGPGFDGQTLAVLTSGNELVALHQGKELWRQRITSHTLTPPLVAGQRVFVLGGDRTVWAFDGLTGRRLWQQPRSGEALVLRQPGLLAAVGDTLVVGISGKLVGLNPLTGSMRWETSIASPRGTNDVERLVDLVSPAARVDDVVCARAFQAAIGCVNANRGNLVWTKYSSGSLGISGNDERLFSVDSDGALQAWNRLDGEKLWSVTWLRGRQSVAPVHANGLVLVGDTAGNLHMFSASEGKLLGRVSTDPSGLVAAPIQVGNTLIAVTASGKVFGWALPN